LEVNEEEEKEEDHERSPAGVPDVLTAFFLLFFY